MSPSRSFSSLLLLASALLLLVPACVNRPGGGGGGGGGDDDDLPPTDDDDAGDDDDAVEVPCDGASDEGDEAEPNNDPADATEFSAGGDLTVTGSIDECANDGAEWTGAADWITNDWVDCNESGTVSLTWTGADDLDLRVWSSPAMGETDLLGNFSTTDPGADGGNIAVDGGVWFEVLCWEGTPGTEWTLTVTF